MKGSGPKEINFCMGLFPSVPGHARIPRRDMDTVQNYFGKSRHVVVNIRGEWHKFDILTESVKSDGKVEILPISAHKIY